MPVQFGDFTLDESRRQLLRCGEPVRLSPKAYQLLSILVEESPRAVSKRDLQDRLWPDTFVTEGSLPTTVAEVRSALGEDRKNPRFLRTLYGFGYAFTATADAPQPAPVSLAARYKVAMFSGLAILAGAIGIVSMRSAPPVAMPPAGAIRSIAVLPFDTSGVGRGDEQLGLGLPDLVITRLSNVRHLIVRPTSAIRDYTGHVDSRLAGKNLQVDAVLEGSIRATPDRIRVTVQLLNTREQKPIWADRFDEKRADMFALEDKISDRVANALMTHLTPNEKTRLAKHYTSDPEAYELYLQARYRQAKRIREGRYETKDSLALLEQAVERDPAYALAWAGLAEIYASSGAFGEISPRVAFERAKADVQKALLDDDLSEAHCAAAIIKMYWDLDYPGAEREFLHALDLNPRNTLAMMHYGRLLVCLGRFEESIALRKREIEVDPLNPAVQWFLAATYLTARQDELAIQQSLLVLKMDPNFVEAHLNLARAYTLRGEFDKAINHAQRAIRIDGNLPKALACLGYALGSAGRTEEARDILDQLDHRPNVQPFDLAIVHFALGHREEVLRLLEKAVEERTYVLRLKAEPIFQPLHSDPRFQSLLRRAGFGTQAS